MGNYRFQCTQFHPKTSYYLPPLEVQGEIRSIFTLINNLIESILPLSGLSPSAEEKKLLLKDQPENINAFVYFSPILETVYSKMILIPAIAYCQEAIKIDPFYQPALYRLINIYERMKKFPEASKNLPGYRGNYQKRK